MPDNIYCSILCARHCYEEFLSIFSMNLYDNPVRYVTLLPCRACAIWGLKKLNHAPRDPWVVLEVASKLRFFNTRAINHYVSQSLVCLRITWKAQQNMEHLPISPHDFQQVCDGAFLTSSQNLLMRGHEDRMSRSSHCPRLTGPSKSYAMSSLRSFQAISSNTCSFAFIFHFSESAWYQRIFWEDFFLEQWFCFVHPLSPWPRALCLLVVETGSAREAFSCWKAKEAHPCYKWCFDSA